MQKVQFTNGSLSTFKTFKTTIASPLLASSLALVLAGTGNSAEARVHETLRTHEANPSRALTSKHQAVADGSHLIPRGRISVLLDGDCDEYSDGLTEYFAELGDEAGVVHLLHDNEDLYVCIEAASGVDLERGFSVLMGASSAKESVAGQPSPYRFSVKVQGEATDRQAPVPWSGAGDAEILEWEGVGLAGSERDSAEYRIPLRGYFKQGEAPIFHIAVEHQLSGRADDFSLWPEGAVVDNAVSFQRVRLEDFVVDSEKSAPSATCYYDGDKDGFGNPEKPYTGSSCPVGYVTNALDCNDSNVTIYTGAAELCDGLDNDCDSVIDDGLVYLYYYPDGDKDGYGNPQGTPKYACAQPAGYVLNNTDCNDANNTIYPGATEKCNGYDDDCDNSIDENVVPTWYRDYDVDQYGDPITYQKTCSQPSGYVSNSKDCNDQDKTIYTGAPELCDGKDNDCDKTVDEGVDGDGDTYTTCKDCNDKDKTIYPGATETCNSKDDDCDGKSDEADYTYVVTFTGSAYLFDEDSWDEDEHCPISGIQKSYTSSSVCSKTLPELSFTCSEVTLRLTHKATLSDSTGKVTVPYALEGWNFHGQCPTRTGTKTISTGQTVSMYDKVQCTTDPSYVSVDLKYSVSKK